jgi:ABC-type phosphate transport system substrate-binding protein
VRLAVYLLIVAALFLARSAIDWRSPFRTMPRSTEPDGPLVVAGAALAPSMIEGLVSDFRKEYPGQPVRLEGGGTNQALEALMNREAGVAFLIRPPTGEEQRLFKSAVGETALVFPMALGGIVLLRSEAAGPTVTSVGALRDFITGGGAAAPWTRLYAGDPNTGLWDAFVHSVGISSTFMPAPGRVAFLESDSAVAVAVAADTLSLGVATSMSLPGDLDEAGLRTVALQGEAGAVSPSSKTIGYGEYPLYHYLYGACRSRTGPRASMFVTYLTSDRGQRHVERAGVLPAREVMRSVVLTRQPLGAGK